MQVTVPIELSEREEAFVVALAKGLKPTRAATAAGYSIATARPLLHKPHVSAAIKHCAANLLDACRRIDAGA
jgi:phage terminase small subunit